MPSCLILLVGLSPVLSSGLPGVAQPLENKEFKRLQDSEEDLVSEVSSSNLLIPQKNSSSGCSSPKR